MNITGNYLFKIIKAEQGYIAEVNIGGHPYSTCGETEEDIFAMIADLCLTVHDIPCSSWNRFWHKVLRLK